MYTITLELGTDGIQVNCWALTVTNSTTRVQTPWMIGANTLINGIPVYFHAAQRLAAQLQLDHPGAQVDLVGFPEGKV